MNRRRALTIAGTIAATTVGATMAIAVNVGLLGFSQADSSPIGALQADQPIELTQETTPATPVPTTDTLPPEVIVQYEDIYVPAPRAQASSAPGEAVPDIASTTVVAAPPSAAAPVIDTTTSSTTSAVEPAVRTDSDEYEHDDDDAYEHEGEADDD